MDGCERAPIGRADFQLPFPDAERAGCTEPGHVDSDAERQGALPSSGCLHGTVSFAEVAL